MAPGKSKIYRDKAGRYSWVHYSRDGAYVDESNGFFSLADEAIEDAANKHLSSSIEINADIDHIKWLKIPVTKEIIHELEKRINIIKDMQPPLDSHLSGIVMGLIEAQRLLAVGVDNEDDY